MQSSLCFQTRAHGRGRKSSRLDLHAGGRETTVGVGRVGIKYKANPQCHPSDTPPNPSQTASPAETRHPNIRVPRGHSQSKHQTHCELCFAKVNILSWMFIATGQMRVCCPHPDRLPSSCLASTALHISALLAATCCLSFTVVTSVVLCFVSTSSQL